MVLTSTLIYYLAYSSLPVDRNYIIIAAIILVDLYFTSNADVRSAQARTRTRSTKPKGHSKSTTHSKTRKHRHGLTPQLKQQLGLNRQRRVRFAPNHTMHSYNPELPPRIMPQMQPPRALSGLPQTTNPRYNQYIMQHQMARGQHRPVQLSSQYHQPGMTQYHQLPEDQQRAPPMIDNRHLVPVDDDSSSSGSSISMDSETISMSSEEY